MTTALLRPRPFSPAATTEGALAANRSKEALVTPATSPNSVRVGPGQRAVTLMPVPLSSWCRASVKERTNALVAK